MLGTALLKKLISIRRQIHKNPELGNREFNTAKCIEKTLISVGLKPFRLTKTGVVAVLKPGGKGGKHGTKKCIALRSDIDALPVEEKSKRAYRSSIPGVMHACGHDANTAILLGCAMLLRRDIGAINPDGCVKFIFQPNEESSGGAQQMVSAGVLKNPRPNVIIGLHVNPLLPVGCIGIKYGEMMSAVDLLEIELSGGGGHAAYPHIGKDVVLAASELIISLQTIVSRGLDPVDPAVLSICTVHGGAKFNVLADRVVLTGTIRTLNKRVRKDVCSAILSMLKCVAGKYKLKYRLNIKLVGSVLSNDSRVVDMCIKSAKKIIPGNKIVRIQKPSMAGEDFAHYLKYTRGCFIYIGSANKDKKYPWHHPRFDIDERCLAVGAKLLRQIALDYLS